MKYELMTTADIEELERDTAGFLRRVVRNINEPVGSWVSQNILLTARLATNARFMKKYSDRAQELRSLQEQRQDLGIAKILIRIYKE